MKLKPTNKRTIKTPESISTSKGQMWRTPLLGMTILALLAAIWAGWIRIGWPWPILQPSLIGAHAPLMVSGFFGTLISLERAVALRRGWPYLGPLLTALGGILLVLGQLSSLAALLLAVGSLWLVLIFGAILRQHLARYTLVMALGAAAWAVGNLLWFTGTPVYQVVLWWAGFLILTIAGERLELGRLVRLPRRVENLFLLLTGLFLAGLLLSILLPSPGTRLASLGLLGLAAWLLRYDIARKTIRKAGLPRFAAISLLTGYAWLVVAATIGLWYGFVPAGSIYDAFLHSIFLGFVFAMIFAHAPIIFPAILGLPIKFGRTSYIPLVLLHLSLLLRVAGDLLFVQNLRLWGGLLNGITILIFLGLTARSVLAGLREKKRQEQPEHPSAPEERAANLAVSANRLRGLWIASLAAFATAGLTGSLMRYWLVAGFPAGINFINVRHAHSHLMYFGWVTPALMLLIAARLPALTGRAVSRGLRWAIGATLIFGLLSYPPFFAWGYETAVIAGARLPLSVIISTFNLLAWYAFMIAYQREVRNPLPGAGQRPLRLWSAALVFLGLASLGAWSRAVLAAFKIEDAFLSTAAVHLFLDLFSNGWAVLGLLGLAYAARPELAKRPSGREDWLLYLGLPLTFLLGMPVDLVPVDLRTLAGLGGLLAAAGLFLHVRLLWPYFSGSILGGWRAPLAFLLLKAGMDAAASLAPLARWGEVAGLRIFYLHVLLLGFVTLGLAAAGFQHWERQPERLQRWLAWSVTGLLLSLLPLTNIWPEILSGKWRLWSALLFSLGPALVVLASGLRLLWRRNRTDIPEASYSPAELQGKML